MCGLHQKSLLILAPTAEKSLPIGKPDHQKSLQISWAGLKISLQILLAICSGGRQYLGGASKNASNFGAEGAEALPILAPKAPSRYQFLQVFFCAAYKITCEHCQQALMPWLQFWRPIVPFVAWLHVCFHKWTNGQM